VNASGLPDHIDVRRLAGVEAVRLPAVIRGRCRMPAWPSVREVLAAVADRAPSVLGPTTGGTYLIVRPIVDLQAREPAGAMRVVVVPAPDPRELLEPDPAAAITELMRTPVDAVCEFVDAVGRSLATGGLGHSAAERLLAEMSGSDERVHRAFLGQLRRMVDGGALRTMIVNELGELGARRMDGWVAVAAPAEQGVTARLAARIPSLRPAGPSTALPMVRGIPTTQLHVTAGNTPIVPVISLLWAWASKGAVVLKPAADGLALAAAIGSALAEVDPDHPLARHTTLAYWRGGDSAVEESLLADGAFERRVMWGSGDALRSLAQRGGVADTIIMRPRYAISFIGRAAVRNDLAATVRLAAVDSVIADQRACMASLLHVVEGTDADADEYARALAEALGRWDEHLPQHMPREVQGRVANVRRGLLASADWHFHGARSAGASTVVRIDHHFDLRRHPGGRVVLVRAVDDLGSAAALHVDRDVSHVGVAPVSALPGLRDVLVGHGADNVVPLGEAERVYAGRPHDGVQVLNRLVRWVNG
jgi:hypothetical protein